MTQCIICNMAMFCESAPGGGYVVYFCMNCEIELYHTDDVSSIFNEKYQFANKLYSENEIKRVFKQKAFL